MREKSAERLLQELARVDVQTVVDPTLLLTKEEWDIVCSPRVIEEDYIFCYFLGTNKNERVLAEKFSQLLNIKLVITPQPCGRFQLYSYDRKFGDERLYDASPEQFLSLIKHARYVFTDSFHAVVFSNVYQSH